MIKYKHNLSKVILMHPSNYQKLINSDRGNDNKYTSFTNFQ